MTSYPSSLKTWTRKIDNADKVIAADVNTLYDEVEEIQRQLGLNVSTSPTWGSGSFSTSTTAWTGGVAARLANIEKGLYDVSQIIDGGTP